MNPERPVPYLSVPFKHYRQRPSDNGWDFVSMHLHLRCTPQQSAHWRHLHGEVMAGRLASPHTLDVDEYATISIQDTETEYAFVEASFIQPPEHGYTPVLRLTDEGDVIFVIDTPATAARPTATDPLHPGTWAWLELYWSEPSAMPAVFRRMAEDHPVLGLDVFTGGLVLEGNRLPALNRVFFDSLTPEDVAPLLGAGERSIRETALARLSDLRGRAR